MIRPFPLQDARRRYELIPQAVIGAPLSALAKRFGSGVEEGSDDFDYYQGAAASMGDLTFAVMHYRGHPENTTTIYLPFNIRDVSEITAIVAKILAELDLSPGLLTWQRRDNPEL